MRFKAGASSADQKYKLLIEELDELSSDLWFFDNEQQTLINNSMLERVQTKRDSR